MGDRHLQACAVARAVRVFLQGPLDGLDVAGVNAELARLGAVLMPGNRPFPRYVLAGEYTLIIEPWSEKCVGASCGTYSAKKLLPTFKRELERRAAGHGRAAGDVLIARGVPAIAVCAFWSKWPDNDVPIGYDATSYVVIEGVHAGPIARDASEYHRYDFIDDLLANRAHMRKQFTGWRK